MDRFTPEKRSEIMSKISGKNTKPELILRKALFAMGLRYRLHSMELTGKPDIVFTSKKVAVFVDGDWWHGRHYKKEFMKYSIFWQEKIKQNMLRDKKVNRELNAIGWKVYRVWQKDLIKDPVKYAKEVDTILKSS